MRRMEYRIAEKLGMLRSAMMRTVTSHELAELVIMENLPWWENRFTEQQQNTPEAQSQKLKAALFGPQQTKGATGGD
jgi:hypothetical protein